MSTQQTVQKESNEIFMFLKKTAAYGTIKTTIHKIHKQK